MARFTRFQQKMDQTYPSSSGGASNIQPPPPPMLRELAAESGVQFNGDAPWDIQVHSDEVYQRILSKGSLGFGESYMDGLWDCLRLDQLFDRLLSFNVDEKLGGWARMRLLIQVMRHRLFNLQSSQRAFQVGEQHYDIGNDVFESMLDPTMSYSCGYWHEADNLDQAQVNKLDMICRKLELKPGEKLLEIGCGWGGLARHAAKNYGVEVLGITISKEQQKLAQDRCAGLPVNIELIDYRDLNGEYDKIVSVGMFEHVGEKNYPIYFDTVRRLLKDNGLFLLHTIGIYKTINRVDPWIDKYIFRNGKLPSAEQLSRVLNERLIIEDWHNFGQDYYNTLMAWWENFDAAWPALSHKYDERFYRMWKYYLMSCAGFFKARQGQLWQLVLSKRSRPHIYRSIR
ncbi:cyclopropane fatty acyl phospholipid synthase [Methylophaga sp. OBS1]|uniref:cyclopropane fatty acyl phospholipid synthase n=1 Tax=Methylophaga sp. OBS1 TaxID=2991933 RepID=UPI00224F30D8|nr:cyclopropane fatty acyl phospholipid synthase [Methylophaga sp. OBS1]MCX4190894.1 cyclopropane fatty acyl phospholipid synthase [Methylophaga sp. OBS1]MCX4192159.1 cyclopropane fatty acyl phospholipid synthase [Methylophaga sp. OBS1]